MTTRREIESYVIAASNRLSAATAGSSSRHRSPSQLHVSAEEPYGPRPPKSTTVFVNGSNAMLADNRADGASGIREPGTSDRTVVVDVDVDVEVDVAECDRRTRFTADDGAAVVPQPVNAHTTTTAIMNAGRVGCLRIITRSMTPCEPVRFRDRDLSRRPRAHDGNTALFVGIADDEPMTVT